MKTRLASFLLAALAIAGCAGTETTTCDPPCGGGSHCTALGCVSDNALACDPVCAPGTHCTDVGCVADASPDMAAGGCAQACTGATPVCRNGQCVACAVDSDCPSGMVCRANGASTVCAPGCNDDARCGGGTMKCCGGACTDTAKDALNCGTCDTACMAANARPACSNGQCVAGACQTGWGDCNQNAADGCEANLHSDSKNCMICGQKCSFAHANAACSDGCYIKSCDFGYDDCNMDPKDGCELTVLSDRNNCGTCGNRCPGVPNATNGCVNGNCQLAACGQGYADCNGKYADGCEIALTNDVKNCGVCGNACGQGLVCIQSTCTCPNCNFANAKSACVNLRCVIDSCNPSYGNCDANDQNGCEQYLLNDPKNCGSCGNACPQGLICTLGGCTCPNCTFPNATTKCINNMCQFDKCLPGFGNCDNNTQNGCEVDLNIDAKNCTACGMQCPQGQSCIAGVCVAFRPNVLLCGSSSRSPSIFMPPNMGFVFQSSCNPDSNTQAIFFSRSWNNGINAQNLQNYLNGGGIAFTEWSITHLIYNLAFNAGAVQGRNTGGCDDTLPCQAQFSPNDQFWKDNKFAPAGAGCGYAVNGYPGITSLCGWDANTASVGYRDLGSGRLWATDFDWQDMDTPNNNYQNTITLMSYMLTHRR